MNFGCPITFLVFVSSSYQSKIKFFKKEFLSEVLHATDKTTQTNKWYQAGDLEASVEFRDENTQNHRIAGIGQGL